MFIIKRQISFLLALMVFASVFVGCNKKTAPEQTPSGTIQERDYNYLTGLPLAPNASTTARPVAVMINNAKAALPQSGLTNAEIIYEMVTEGGVTRMMAVYSDIDSVGRVGPVRSSRDQFVEFLLPINAIYVHIGTSIYAKDMLNFYSYQDIDGIYLGTIAFEFDSERNKTKSSEHCWFTNSELIKAGMKQTNIQQKTNLYPAFQFVSHTQEPRVLNGKDANTISFAFSDYANVDLNYDTTTGRYLKSAFGAPQVDADTNLQLAFENVILLLTDVGTKPDAVCADFELEEGTGYYFYGGKYEQIKWEKGKPENPLILKTLKGEPLSINVGKSYVAVLGNDMKDTLSISEVVSSVASVDRVQ